MSNKLLNTIRIENESSIFRFIKYHMNKELEFRINDTQRQINHMNIYDLIFNHFLFKCLKNDLKEYEGLIEELRDIKDYDNLFTFYNKHSMKNLFNDLMFYYTCDVLECEIDNERIRDNFNSYLYYNGCVKFKVNQNNFVKEYRVPIEEYIVRTDITENKLIIKDNKLCYVEKYEDNKNIPSVNFINKNEIFDIIKKDAISYIKANYESKERYLKILYKEIFKDKKSIKSLEEELKDMEKEMQKIEKTKDSKALYLVLKETNSSYQRSLKDLLLFDFANIIKTEVVNCGWEGDTFIVYYTDENDSILKSFSEHIDSKHEVNMNFEGIYLHNSYLVYCDKYKKP